MQYTTTTKLFLFYGFCVTAHLICPKATLDSGSRTAHSQTSEVHRYEIMTFEADIHLQINYFYNRVIILHALHAFKQITMELDINQEDELS